MNIPDRTDKRRRKGQEGATLMELALILPVFVLLVFGLIELGHSWYITHAINAASREGARHGIRYRNGVDGNRLPPASWSAAEGDLQSVEARVKNYLKFFFDESYVNNEVTVKLAGTNPGTPPEYEDGDSPGTTENESLTVIVIAPKPWPILGPLIGLADTKITAITTMKLE